MEQFLNFSKKPSLRGDYFAVLPGCVRDRILVAEILLVSGTFDGAA